MRHSSHLSLKSILCGVALFGFFAQAQEVVNPRSLLPGPGIATVRVLSQNWGHRESNDFYNSAQGSQLIPYSWFLSLEQADNQAKFNDPDHIRSLGFLPRAPDNSGNPDGLPVGFVRDFPFPDGSPALGISCAACHTNQINLGSTAWLIDGAPTLGDMEQMLKRLEAALKTTLTDEAKFTRFADSVLKSNLPKDREQLRTSLNEVQLRRKAYNEQNLSPAGGAAYGHGRVDAFGAIINQVTATFLNLPENLRKADAPVSYPALWDTPQHDRVQWNGIAENKVSKLAAPFVGTRHIGALGRNTGEVLGVFADLDLVDQGFSAGYKSSINREKLIEIEESIRKLWSPQWPVDFGAIDERTSRRGETLFNNHCAACHTNNQRNHDFDRKSPDRVVTAKMRFVGTDPGMYLNIATRRARTGVLEGRRRSLNSIFDRLQKEEPVQEIIGHVIQRVIIGRNFEVDAVMESLLAELDEGISLDIALNTPEGLVTGNFVSILPDGDGGAFRVVGTDIRLKPADGVALEKEEFRLAAAPGGKLLLRGVTKSIPAESLKNFTEIARLDETTLPQPGEKLKVEFRITEADIEVRYKARPLNGIWATAPYLHNGSIPSLRALLTPEGQRPATFKIGSRNYDVKNVGFDPTNGPSTLDTTLKGNSNKGHNFGVHLSDTEKDDLIDYLKSL